MSNAHREVTVFYDCETSVVTVYQFLFRYRSSFWGSIAKQRLQNHRCFGYSVVTTWHGLVQCRKKTADCKIRFRYNGHQICILPIKLFLILMAVVYVLYGRLPGKLPRHKQPNSRIANIFMHLRRKGCTFAAEDRRKGCIIAVKRSTAAIRQY
jgi:hypothetical protein